MLRNRHLFALLIALLAVSVGIAIAHFGYASEGPLDSAEVPQSDSTDGASASAGQASGALTSGAAAAVATKRHQIHPEQDSVWIQGVHDKLKIPFYGPLDEELKQSITAALSQAAESTSATASLAEGEQQEFASLTEKKRFYERAHGLALLFGELEALAKDRYIRFGGEDFHGFYMRCLNQYPDAYFACVGCDQEGKQIVLVVPAPQGSQLATLADVTVDLAQQGY